MPAEVRQAGGRGPCVVVVGAASRDLTKDDPRGWRLGGGVTYGALTLARLGIRTAALIGLDPEAMDAPELDLLRAAGVEMVGVQLAHGPVFVNRETPRGRIQTAVDVSDALSRAALPTAWEAAPGWLFAPVAGELPEDWAHVPRADATVAIGWQGQLRTLRAGAFVQWREPWPSALVAGATLIGVSLRDLAADWTLETIDLFAPPGTDVLVTAGCRGGLLARLPIRSRQFLRYPAVSARTIVDETGAGDVALATLLAAGLARGGAALPRAAANDWPASRGRHLLLAAAAAGLSVEQPGLHGVPTLAALRERLAARNAKTQAT